MVRGYDIDERSIPLWLAKAVRRKRLLGLGISLGEQADTATYELDAILAVDDVLKRVEKERMDDVQR